MTERERLEVILKEQDKWIAACLHDNPASLSTIQGTYVAEAIRKAKDKS